MAVTDKKVQEWSDEHPEPKKKTYADYFFECFPNGEKYKDGLPTPCREHVYGVQNKDCLFTTCYSCWSEPMPDNFFDMNTNRDE